MKRLSVILILLLTLGSGCVSPASDQPNRAGNLILHKDQIKSASVYNGHSGEDICILKGSELDALVSKMDDIAVKKLSKNEDKRFMQPRIKDNNAFTVNFLKDGADQQLYGYFITWPSGEIYMVDVISMKSDQRTISYLSQAKHPSIYQWLNKKQKGYQKRLIYPSDYDPRAKQEWTKMNEMDYDLDTDNEQETIQLFTAAKRDKKGDMMWDDGQKWLLIIKDGSQYYTLRSEYVQLGKLFFTITHNTNEQPKVTVIASYGAGLDINNYAYNHEKQAYLKELVYQSMTINCIDPN